MSARQSETTLLRVPGKDRKKNVQQDATGLKRAYFKLFSECTQKDARYEAALAI